MAETRGGNGRDSGEVTIEVDQLTKYFGTLPALRDISFRARRGEIVGFLGPNGAGKTTTMRILTGFMPPSRGSARVAGHDVVEASMDARRATGYLPENTPLYPEMSVYGYLDFMARLHGVSDRRTAIERVMSQVAIDDRADDLVGHLSKGYRQRVGLAQALAHDPEVLILDEPTIGLDPRQIREVRSLIRSLGGNHTVLLSTHILPEAQQICDRVLIINQGRIVAEDAPDDLTARMTGGEQVRLALPADLAVGDVTALLAAVPGVEAVEATGDGGFTVTAAQDVSPGPALAEAVVGRGWPLHELTPVAVTLEDIFLELTSEEDLSDVALDEPDDDDGVLELTAEEVDDE